MKITFLIASILSAAGMVLLIGGSILALQAFFHHDSFYVPYLIMGRGFMLAFVPPIIFFGIGLSEEKYIRHKNSPKG